MLLTDRFVYVHLPKTAGTFVTRMIERALAARGEPPPVNVNKHGSCYEIPQSHRHLPILTTIRSPWSRFVSQYLFRWWKRNPADFVDWEAVKRRFPHHPDLSFADFVRMVNGFFHKDPASARPPADRLGFQSRQLVLFYARDPAATFARLDDAWIREGRWREEFFPVRFLRQEDLNREVHDALVEVGFAPEEVAFVLEEGRILPKAPRGGKRPDRPWREYWTPDIFEEARAAEPLALAMFPEYADLRPGGRGA